eukprot:CAMPEP_0183721604 /NCGR_PEP_ID=MMETSP0737-20130205/13825_1 /TAXON_ID=385413 /ORGANISM="Thalassiosira miniscula, Strain CCMP1093" /LENGTH=531 /DNA_ID=CAMNT_0025951641 /DNA_START=105 /DNA_END=1700 /DNA_ORIENTATION=+
MILGMSSHAIAEQQSSPLSSSSNDDEEATQSIDLSNLSEIIREAYNSGETDGVHNAFTSNNILATLTSTTLDVEEVAIQLVGAAMEAAGNDRGKLSAMINAIIASCCGGGDDGESTESSQAHPELSLAILDVMDEMHEMDDKAMVTPDIVSLSLVYYSLNQSKEHESESQIILERAQRRAKKMAGSQLRKALAAERRKGSSKSNTDNMMDVNEVTTQLQSLYGPDIHILHETNDIIILSKPAGMVLYHSKKTSAGKITASRKKKSRAANNASGSKGGAKQVDISLVDALLDVPNCGLSTVNPTARGIVHRLDRGTSGTIVLAKTDEIHLKLVALFFLRRVKKTYLALVPGCDGSDEEESDIKKQLLTMGSTGVIDAPVNGRPARSTYKVVGEYHGSESQSSSVPPEALLLEMQTFTGRKHQVRVHCAAGLGRPIFLDPKYSSSSKKSTEDKKTKQKEKRKKTKKQHQSNGERSIPNLPKLISDQLEGMNLFGDEERFFLHATSLSIPELGISVDAPLPSWWIDDVRETQLN